jgi:tryptophan-rich sensory protein
MQSSGTGVKEWIGLLVSLVICFAVAGLGSLATTPNIPTWYATLNKPSWNPPNWLFGPVWTALYAMMAVAVWLVWKKTGWNTAVIIFAVQLALNLAWSFIFFGFHQPGLAFLEIVLLWLAIAATILMFFQVSTVAASLLIPYLLWVSFAAALNFTIWRLNG